MSTAMETLIANIPPKVMAELVEDMSKYIDVEEFEYTVGGKEKYRVKKKVFMDTVFVLGKFPKLPLYAGIQYIRNPKDGQRMGAFLFTSITGRTGMGKSTLLLMYILQALNFGYGVFVADPHGSLVRDVLKRYPEHRLHDLIVIDPLAITKYRKIITIDFLAWETEDQMRMLKEMLTDLFLYVFGTIGGSIMKKASMYIASLLVESAIDRERNHVCLQDAYWVLVNDKRRMELAESVIDPDVKRYFVGRGEESFEMIRMSLEPVIRRLEPLAKSIIAPIFKYSPGAVTPWQVIDDGLVVLANLAKGEIGEHASDLLAQILVRAFFMSALKPDRLKMRKRIPFLFVVDEAHNFTLDTYRKILAEGRKYDVMAIFATQYPSQYVAEKNVDAWNFILQNGWVFITFNMSRPEGLEKVMGEKAFECSSLPQYHFLVKHKYIKSVRPAEIIDPEPYVLTTIPLPKKHPPKIVEKIVDFSLTLWGADVEDFVKYSLTEIKGMLLEAMKIVLEKEGATVTEIRDTIAERLKIPRVYARRLLNILVSRRYVYVDETTGVCTVPDYAKEKLKSTMDAIRKDEELAKKQDEMIEIVFDDEGLVKDNEKYKEYKEIVSKRRETASLVSQAISELSHEPDDFKYLEDMDDKEIIEKILINGFYPGAKYVEEDGKKYLVIDYTDIVEKANIPSLVKKKLLKERILVKTKIQVLFPEDIEENNIDTEVDKYIVVAKGELPVIDEEILKPDRTYILTADDVEKKYHLTLYGAIPEIEEKKGGEKK